jgi:hypothetical protein
MLLNDGVGGQQDLRSDGHRSLPAHGHLVTLCVGGRQHDAPGRTLCHALAVLDPPRVHGHHFAHAEPLRAHSGVQPRDRCADRCAVTATGTSPFWRSVLC